MVHRLTQNRLFMIALAALMLLAMMPWQGAMPCCCSDAEDVPTTGTCCGVVANPDPETPETCPCIMAGKAMGLPAVVDPNGSEQAPVVLHPAAGPVAGSIPIVVQLRAPLPRARTGPALHLRLQVLLI